ncbi:MAG TPA: prolyl oligopeptidase family serine peptidase [Actinomycetota bacterium]|nr:prolyl oligopeptidase family serine peptidase [Actinomycetota bacterium]
MAELDRIETHRVPVTTTYHGVEVTEEYRWLEDAASEETRAWTGAQHERAMAYLRSLPSYGDIRRRAEELLKVESTSYAVLRQGGGTSFALKQQPPKQQPFLVTLTDLSDASTERVLVDPNAIDPSGATTIDWYEPSPDGRLVAVSLSEHGTEDGTLYVYETATGDLVDVRIPRVNSGTAGGSMAWRGDSTGFWYTHHPERGEDGEDTEFFEEVWFHAIGEATDDRRDLAGVFADNRIVENFLSSSPDGRWVLDRAQKGDGGEWQLFARSQDGGEWWMLAEIPDRVVDAAFGSDAIFLLSTKDAPHGQILRLPMSPGVTVAEADVVVPQSALTIEGLAVTDGRLWVLDMDGGPSGLRAFGHDGEPLPGVELPPVCAIDGVTRLGADRIAYPVETFVSPSTWWVATDTEAAPRPTALDTVMPLDFSGIEVRRVFATSEDGTQVPISLIARTGILDAGPAPTMLTAYGGYGISLKPWFVPGRLLWLEQGAVLAIANIRGGGEYGEEWHHAGRLLTKQTCFDDFAACARHLVSTGVTKVERLVIRGGSNGGLLMGAVLTQHPDIATAAIVEVPVLDMLRVELHPNGAFNVTEYGTVQDPDAFAALYAYSPYHRVVDGTRYPAVLLTAGEFDPRVDAYHAKKMAARLQAATSSDAPILLRIESGGHGIGQSLDQAVGLLSDLHAFAFAQLGVAWSG